MNKSITTNFIALVAALVGYFSGNSIIFTIGIFALSGAVTNWLAVHMLFEKVPGLYGSGVIPSRFEEFKLGIRHLMMEQFFTQENIDRFLHSTTSQASAIDLEPVIETVDLSPAFDNLLEVIEQSSFGPMLAMAGGTAVLEPMREPFMVKMKNSIRDIAQSDSFNESLKAQLEQPNVVAGMRDKVSDIIEQRLNELTPSLVKDIVQTMIREHLGWLVVWGGVFGGVIGLIAAISEIL